MKEATKDGEGIKITVKPAKKSAAYCGGGCNGCSCGRCKGGFTTTVQGKIPDKNA